MHEIKRIPYGKGDFEALNAQNDYFVDKTIYIPRIEKTPYIFLIRPRRFGKTLFMSMLQPYYDIKKEHQFQNFFRDTWILDNPTLDRAQYMVLYFNFSVIAKDKVQDDFNSYCRLVIDDFLVRYADHIPEDVCDMVQKERTAHAKLQFLSGILRNNPVMIYLMIDEYDNFTNTLLSEYGPAEYQKIVKEAGYFKQFFTNLKAMASGSGAGLARMFITGVSPVTMDDVTSGFNVGNNISVRETFNCWDCSLCRKKWLTLWSTVVHGQAVGATGRSPLHRTEARKQALRFVNQF